MPTDNEIENNVRAMFRAKDKVNTRKRGIIEEKIEKILKEREENQKKPPTPPKKEQLDV